MRIDTTARLVSVFGDQESFSDLVGLNGRLFLDVGNNWFGPSGSSESLTMDRKRMTQKGDTIRVSTKRGNVFVFKTK